MRNPKILIVEDEMITLDHLRRILTRFGYEVTGVTSSAAALDKLEQICPDLLLADIGIEGEVDGIEVAARAREDWNIPTVFLTAYSDPETLRRARITEPYGYLIKPFVEQELHATLEIALQQKALRAQEQYEASATAQMLVHTQDELSAVTARLFETQEQERAEIARDLHDDIGQRLALLQMDLAALWEQFPAEVRQAEQTRFQHVLRGAVELSDLVRNVSHRLHPAILDDLGLVAAIRKLSEEFAERYEIPTRVSVRSVPDQLSPEISVPLYRITQEALRNVARHAGPARVNIALIGATSTLELSIRDSGKGFDPLKLPKRPGLGLISMAERVSALGGKFNIDSRPGEGARIHVSVPLRPDSE